MISFLEGTLAEKSGDRVVIGVQGTGYEVLAPSATIAKLPPVGKPVKVYTRLHVRDDAIDVVRLRLPGRASALRSLDHRETASARRSLLAFLSVLTPDALRVCGRGRRTWTALTIVPGVGKKVAQRVVLDLKDRIGGGRGRAGRSAVGRAGRPSSRSGSRRRRRATPWRRCRATETAGRRDAACEALRNVGTRA
jgi:Holliday junction DNA helicase RuvA